MSNCVNNSSGVTLISDDISVDRVIIVGDIGGHYQIFYNILTKLGVLLPSIDTDLTSFFTDDLKNSITVKVTNSPSLFNIPQDLTIIQVGDLVHKGPDSHKCVMLATLLLMCNPKSYIQLLGNHEAHYLGGVDHSNRSGVNLIDRDSVLLLQNLWVSDKIRIASGFTRNDGKNFLVTHAGLTKGFYEKIGSPNSLKTTVKFLNNLRNNPDLLFTEGDLTSGRVSFAAGVLYARTNTELVDSWVSSEIPPPFSQVHGHESAWLWEKDSWFPNTPARVRNITTINKVSRFTTALFPNSEFFTSIDWVLGSNPSLTQSYAVFEALGRVV